MQVTGQNVSSANNQNSFNCAQKPIQSQTCCNQTQTPQQTQTTAQTPTTPQAQTQNSCCQHSAATNPVTPAQNHYPAGYVSPQNMYPQANLYAGNVTSTIPAGASGVNIQIFNPSVGTPGAAPTYNVNAPCYPSSYYTGSVGPDGKLYPNNSGFGQRGDNTNNGTIDGNVNTGTNNGTIGNNNGNGTNGTGGTGATGNNSGVGQVGNNTNNGSIDGNVNTGTNNGTIGNGNNSNNVTNNNTTIDNSNNKKKTEKRKIVELTDDYIRNLENYLNSPDKQVRLNAAKEVYARLEEDDSRFDDKALNALVNKMLQDPSSEVRFLALSALDGRICKGDDYTVGVLKNMQANNNDPLNQEAADASSILLKMSSREVEKEFEVKENSKKKETKTETTTTKESK